MLYVSNIFMWLNAMKGTFYLFGPFVTHLEFRSGPTVLPPLPIPRVFWVSMGRPTHGATMGAAQPPYMFEATGGKPNQYFIMFSIGGGGGVG